MSVGLPCGIEELDFSKGGGLLPVVVQDAATFAVLMVGFADRPAVERTLETGLVTFHSRTRGETWTKGETSGNTLRAVSIDTDCDRDTLLIMAEPAGPTCHTGAISCFDEGRSGASNPRHDFLAELNAFLTKRDEERPEGSYTTSLFEAGIRRIAQKVGEEGVETALAAVAQEDEFVANESADLIYHLIVLLQARGLTLADVVEVLRGRHR